MQEPYKFPWLLTDFDRYLLNQGQHWRLYHKLGAAAAEAGRPGRRQFRRLGS